MFSIVFTFDPLPSLLFLDIGKDAQDIYQNDPVGVFLVVVRHHLHTRMHYIFSQRMAVVNKTAEQPLMVSFIRHLPSVLLYYSCLHVSDPYC
jgi:hypothetical protein